MNRVGLTPVPDDTDIVKFLEKIKEDSSFKVNALVEEFEEVVHYGQEEGEPEIFAYARLLNHLAMVEHGDLIRMLATMVYQEKGN